MVTAIPSSTGMYQKVLAVMVDSSGSATPIKISRLRENLAGSAGTGNDGDANRVYTLSTTSDPIDIVEVYLDGVLLVEATSYSVDNTLKQITMIVNVFDSQVISSFYNV